MKRLTVPPLFILITVFCFMVTGQNVMAMSSKPAPPGQAASGFGSPENYITSGYSLTTFGSVLDGSYCYTYEPDQLKNGSSAPVVLFLHGMILLAPEIYQDHITHLCQQGYIVIFPQFQQSILTLMFDMDQRVYLDRAVEAANKALARLGSKVEMDNLVLYGHSLGGLLALSWSDEADAPAARNIVLANPSVDMTAAMPVEIPGMDWLMGLFIDMIDYEAKAAVTTAPVTLLTGNDDSIAPDWTVVDAYNALVNSPEVALYRFNTDKHGDPDLLGDHMAGICDDGWMPSWLMSFIGGDGEVDALDYRFYWAALDAALNGQASLDFDMGNWSDGVPVNAVEQLAP